MTAAPARSAPARRTTSLLLLGAGLLLLTLLGLGAQPPGTAGSLPLANAHRYIACVLLSGALYAAAIPLARRPLPRWTLSAILLVGLAARLLVLVHPPILSTDIYRYVWDGRVQAAGINPYRFIPADPALVPLRDTAIGPTAIFPNINRVDSAPTIYPPFAQFLFALIGLAAPSIYTVKAVMLGMDLLAGLAALALLRAAERPFALVLVWAWNPLVIWEFAGAGHIDAAAVAAIGWAMVAATYAWRRSAGALLAAAVLFKLLPAAVFPALWRRWDLRTPLTAALVVILSYCCYVSAGLRVFGYLPGYATEEGLDGGGFLLVRLLRLLVPTPPWVGTVYAAAALLLLLLLAARVALPRPLPREIPARAHVIASGALVLSGALIAVLSPHYPWYMTALALPAVLVPAWSALWLTIAAPLLYLDHGHDQVLFPALVFLPALPLLALDLFGRRLPAPGAGSHGVP